jgi:hypothetical protein
MMLFMQHNRVCAGTSHEDDISNIDDVGDRENLKNATRFDRLYWPLNQQIVNSWVSSVSLTFERLRSANPDLKIQLHLPCFFYTPLLGRIVDVTSLKLPPSGEFPLSTKLQKPTAVKQFFPCVDPVAV